MTDKQKKDIRIKIEKLIQDSFADIEVLEEATAPISPENSIGRVSRMDAINNKSVVESSLRQSKSKLAKLKIALTKIDGPNFGKCMRCGKDIQEKRLMFLPQSDRCIHCAI